LASLLLSDTEAAPLESPDRPWRFAIVPQLTPVELLRNWSAILQQLGKAGIDCQLVLYPDIAKFEVEFLRGQADFVYLNPYHMVMAHERHAYQPLLHDKRALEGLLLTQADGPVSRIEQLQQQRISFPSANAFAASLYLRALLERQHHVGFQAHYAQNHRNALRQVLTGDSAACGVVATTFESETADVKARLRVLLRTPAVAPHPIAAHPRVPLATRQRLSDTLLHFANTEAGQPLMQAIAMPHPVAADYRSDYAPLLKLHIEHYVVNAD
ncbi:MAG: phosphate/phosphite/phosphonate ABC transporter substrate-binding protein, partial [Sphingomonadaceae bacterium]